MFVKKAFAKIITLFVFVSCLAACNKSDRKNVTNDFVFCYLTSSYIDDAMDNWGCYSDIISYTGNTFLEQKGFKFEYDQNIAVTEKTHAGRLFAFNSNSYILGGTYGMGYINQRTNKLEVAIKTPIISRADGKVFFLSINSSYSRINDDTGWSVISLDTASFVSLIFHYFSSDSDGQFGYSSYNVLYNVFIKHLTDYSDEYAKTIVWNNGIREVNLYSELQTMKSNYYRYKTNSLTSDFLLFLLGGIMCSVLVGGIVIVIIFYKKHEKGII